MGFEEVRTASIALYAGTSRGKFFNELTKITANPSRSGSLAEPVIQRPHG
jgi:hypothetical protein